MTQHIDSTVQTWWDRLDPYAEVAFRLRQVEHIVAEDEEVWIVTVPELQGVWSTGATQEQAEWQLEDIIRGWVVVKNRVLAGDIPVLEGIDVNATRTR